VVGLKSARLAREAELLARLVERDAEPDPEAGLHPADAPPAAR
jgi:hypothetical protein